MAGNTDHLSEIQRKNLDAAVRLVQMSLDNSQRIMGLQADLVRKLVDSGAQAAKDQSDAKDPQQLMSLRTAYAQNTAQQLMQAAQEMAQLGNSVRDEFSRLLAEQLASGSTDMTEAFQGFLKTLPAGSEQWISVVQQAMSQATAAFTKGKK
ncbi:MAG: phasin family protein [Proteobacteria bacterium]|nr:phasin family protein [Pseudomonadota bacterium]HQR03404.1 phasin family protein [Rhodocyclaceae bacterium]